MKTHGLLKTVVILFALILNSAHANHPSQEILGGSIVNKLNNNEKIELQCTEVDDSNNCKVAQFLYTLGIAPKLIGKPVALNELADYIENINGINHKTLEETSQKESDELAKRSKKRLFYITKHMAKAICYNDGDCITVFHTIVPIFYIFEAADIGMMPAKVIQNFMRRLQLNHVHKKKLKQLKRIRNAILVTFDPKVQSVELKETDFNFIKIILSIHDKT